MRKEKVWRVSATYLEKYMKDVFCAIGVPSEDAAICAEVLITSDLRGIESHGINRCKPIYYDRIKAGIQNPVTRFEIVREGKTTAVVDGHNGMGHAIAHRCMEMAIDKAEEHGMGMVVARNSTHYGIAGYYPLMAARVGMIGITGTNARPSIAPTFGIENMLGTNPLCFGFPTDEPFPFVLDCATSISQRGKIEVYEREGKKLPAGWVIDRKGRMRTDAAGVLRDLVNGSAALLPLGGAGEDLAGYKGYGYATVVEVLSSALQCGNSLKQLTGVKSGKKAPIELGHFFIAIDVDEFLPLHRFKKNAGNVMRALRASQKAPGAKRIYTAGEKEYIAMCERKKKGIPISGAGRKDIDTMRAETGIKGYKFPWDKKQGRKKQ